MTDAGKDDAPELGAFFAAAKVRTPEPGTALFARVMADAEAVQAGFALAPVATSPALGSTVRARLAVIWQALGGWPSVAGLSAATVAGLWIGIAPPAALGTVAPILKGGAATFVIDAEPVTAFLLPEEAM